MKVQKRNKSIKEWSEVFSELYSQADSKRTPEQMWIAVMAHTSSIGEFIRTVSFENLLDSAAHTFCWLCSFVNKCNELQNDIFSIKDTLSEIVFLKYPGVCGHCMQQPCKCDPVRMERGVDKSAFYKNLLDRRNRDLGAYEKYSINDSMTVFRDIYSGRIHIQTLESIGFHFLEEIGETALCVRKLSQLRKITDDIETGIDVAFLKELSTVEGIVKNFIKLGELWRNIDYVSTEPKMLRTRVVEAKMGLVGEIGDSFSWFCSILNKLDSISNSIFINPKEHPEFLKPLDQVLNEIYLDSKNKPKCPSCSNNPCKCIFYNLNTGNQCRVANAKSGRKRRVS